MLSVLSRNGALALLVAVLIASFVGLWTLLTSVGISELRTHLVVLDSRTCEVMFSSNISLRVGRHLLPCRVHQGQCELSLDYKAMHNDEISIEIDHFGYDSNRVTLDTRVTVDQMSVRLSASSGGEVWGRVLDALGEPVPFAQILEVRVDGWRLSAEAKPIASSDANGDYRVKLRGGSWRLTAAKDNQVCFDPALVQVRRGGLYRADLRLGRFATLRLRFPKEHHFPRIGFSVTEIGKPRTGFQTGIEPSTIEPTVAEGLGEVELMLRPVRQRIALLDASNTSPLFSRDMEVCPTPGQEIVVDIRRCIELKPSTLTGQVVDVETELPVVSARVSASGLSVDATAITDQNGVFRIEFQNHPKYSFRNTDTKSAILEQTAGCLSVRFDKDGYRTSIETVTFDDLLARHVTVRMVKSALLRVWIEESDSPLSLRQESEVVLMYRDGGNAWRFLSEPVRYGRAVFRDVPPTEVRVYVDQLTFSPIAVTELAPGQAKDLSFSHAEVQNWLERSIGPARAVEGD